MSAGVKTKGFDKAMSRFREGALPYENTLDVAIKASLNVLRKNARILLKAYVYDKPGRGAWEEALTGRLYKSFRAVVLEVSGAKGAGVLRNTAPEAVWVEHGVKPHPIDAKNVQALHWIDSLGDAFSKHVEHPGFEGVEFMKGALAMSRPEIREIFLQAFKSQALGGPIPLSIASDLYQEDDGETIGTHALVP